MRKNVSYINFFIKLFGTVCNRRSTILLLSKKQDKIDELLKELEDERNIYNSLFQKYLETDNVNTKLTEDLTIAKDKIKHYNNLLSEHKKLRELYETLNARFHKHITSNNSLKKDSEQFTEVTKETIDSILRMKRSRRSYEKIASTFKLPITTVKEIYAKYK
jgi:uncharacterized phage infection (PIP) family protein YhgE